MTKTKDDMIELMIKASHMVPDKEIKNLYLYNYVLNRRAASLFESVPEKFRGIPVFVNDTAPNEEAKAWLLKEPIANIKTHVTLK